MYVNTNYTKTIKYHGSCLDVFWRDSYYTKCGREN